MKKRYFVGIILIIFLSLSGNVLALKNKPKLVLPLSSKEFASTSPGITTNAAIRAAEYITPDGAKLYNSDALFEWNQPDCSKFTCKVFIEHGNSENPEQIHCADKITANNYKFSPEKYKLKRGEVYNFYVISNMKPEDISDMEAAENSKKNPLKFYYLSKDEKQQITNQITKIEKNANKMDQLIDETNILVQNGIWFDTINNINKLISFDPGNKELDDYKYNLYKIVKQKQLENK